MKRLVKYMVDKSLRHNYIPLSQVEELSYCIEVTLASIINVLLCIVISCILNVYVEGVFFLIIFGALRMNSGGFHFDKQYKCIISFAITYMCVLVMIQNIQVEYIYLVFISLVLSFIIWLLAPLEDANKPLSTEEKVQYKKRVVYILIISNLLVISDIFTNYKGSLCITIGLLSVTMLLMIAYIKKHPLKLLNKTYKERSGYHA